MKKSHSLSIIIPVHNEAANTKKIYEAIKKSIDDQVSEFIFVNDGSIDDSIDNIHALIKKDSRVRVIDFSRNFGKEAATSAGLDACTGEAAIILDCDGQHPPKLLPEFIKRWEEGYDSVIGRRVSNETAGFVKTTGSKLYQQLLRSIHSGNHVTGDTDFRLIDRKVIDAFRAMHDHNRVTRSLLNWLGFSVFYIDFEAEERMEGVASYSFKKLVKLAIDGLTTSSMRPLLFAAFIGAVTLVLGVLLGITMIIEQFILGDPLRLHFSGTAYLAIFILVTTGLILVGQGIQGAYLANIYNDTRNRPLYVVKEITPSKKAKK
jgi:dolichol-phosphate mannosyltransferase